MKVWLTRSEPGASRQAQELRAAGYDVLIAPVLTIAATGVEPPATPPDVAIFLSEHAVGHAENLAMFRGCRVLAIGTRTRDVLAAAGIDAGTAAIHTSEGLLQLPELAELTGKRVLLVAGEGGRDLLAQTLTERGASVEIYRSYRRLPCVSPHIDPAVVAAIVVASGDAVQAVATVWRAAGGKADIPLLVPSARVAAIAQQLQFDQVLQCAGADSRAILSGLQQIPVS